MRKMQRRSIMKAIAKIDGPDMDKPVYLSANEKRNRFRIDYKDESYLKLTYDQAAKIMGQCVMDSIDMGPQPPERGE